LGKIKSYKGKLSELYKVIDKKYEVCLRRLIEEEEEILIIGE
jgi:hypothetical protein